MINIQVDRRDAGRILNVLRERHRKIARGLTKFGTDFDPTLGANIVESEAAFRALIQKVEGYVQEDNPRGAGRDSTEPKERDERPRDNRSHRL